MFIQPALPRVVRVGEEHFRPHRGGNGFMAGELLAIVDRGGTFAVGRDRSKGVADALDELRRGLAPERERDKELRFPVHEGPHVSLLASAFDRVAFPVAQARLLFHDGWPFIDEGAVRDDSPAILA